MHVLSDEEKPGFEHGFITAELIKKYGGEEYSIFMCGPQAMYNFLDGEIAKLGLRRKFVRRELFGMIKDPWNQPGYPEDIRGKTFNLKVIQCGKEYDITASAEGRGLFTDILRETASRVFIPLTVGGGINTLDDFDRVLKCGADKVSVNSGALKDPSLIPAAAKRYGDQCVVLSADVKRVGGQFRVFAKGGREDTGRDALEWIKWCVDNGAGEVCLNSIDTDGVRNGFDLEMLDAVAARVNVPIIASGGAGKKEDFLELFRHEGIDAGLAAGIFHQKLLTIRALKEYLNKNGVEMRL